MSRHMTEVDTLRGASRVLAAKWIGGCLLVVSAIMLTGCGGKAVGEAPSTQPNPVAPAITAQPQSQSVAVGQPATFSVTASGTAPFTYQWKRGTTEVGTNSNSYTTPATTTADNSATFSVVVTNAAGHADSSPAVLTVTSGVVAPAITTQPQDQTVVVGQPATFSVVASGTAPLTYQWKRGAANVGTNSFSYTTSATTAADNSAKFSVVVTNAVGHATSAEATLTVNPATGTAILVNHTNTNLAQIPAAQITAARQSLRIAYGHTSHGSQVVSGMNALAAKNSAYAWNSTGTGGALGLDDGAMGGIDVGYYPDWVNNTRSYLGAPNASGRGATRPAVNVIMWAWCGQAATLTEKQMLDEYLSPMTQLEKDYPGVKFVYLTGHLDGTGVNGQLNQRNEQIRAYCKANGKILFDFADIESYDPDGATNFMPLNCDADCNYVLSGANKNWADLWLAAHPGSELAQLATACKECAHSQNLNCIQKGRAAWWLWARLAGWNGQ